MIIRNKHKAAFDKIAADAYAAAASYLGTLSDSEAKEAARIIKELNEHNCHWYLFQAKGIFAEAIRSDDCGRDNFQRRMYEDKKRLEATAIELR